jgi:predicted aldo/keto reductase-like oxidoreductase
LCDIWSHSLSLLATGIIIDNLVAILKHAILDFGINHIEAARGYGSSELQLGVALKQLYASTDIKREDLIIQSKVPSDKNVDEFRRRMELTFRNLQVDYLDLFAFHGFNGEWQWEWMFGGEDNCWNVIQEYKAAGKIRHVGFSTHGPNELISRAIETDKFDYVNLHHHFCGSYTASGDGPNGTGNLKCLRLMKERDMGGKCVHFNCRRNVASLVLCCND